MKKINGWLDIIIWASMLFLGMIATAYIDALIWTYGALAILGFIAYFGLFVIVTEELFNKEA